MIAYIYSAIIGASLAGSILLWEARPHAAPAPAAAQAAQEAPGAFTPTTDRESAALALLAAVGNAQPTLAMVAEVVAWSIAEDGGDGAMQRNNPWNTTMCGHNFVAAINGDGACGVAGYATFEDGIQANAATLAQSNFSEVRQALLSNDVEGFKAALWASPWASSHYNGGVDWPHYAIAAPAPALSSPAGKKCPYTATMQIGEGSSFSSTGSGYWAGQYGGMHLGDDFVGNPGDPVYAPFDMQIESVGEYTDPGRLGKNIQARFMSDHTLYYAGHLIDVYVSQGETVPACTIIGTLGATAGPHTHIKLAGPDAPVPCEGSPPGLGGCIDPMEYWETH